MTKRSPTESAPSFGFTTYWATSGSPARSAARSTVGMTGSPAADISTSAHGKDIGELAGIENLGVAVGPDAASAVLGADICIDFSSPKATPEVARAVMKERIGWVCGTTGIDEGAKRAVSDASKEVPVLHEANMSIGVQILADIVRDAVERSVDDADAGLDPAPLAEAVLALVDELGPAGGAARSWLSALALTDVDGDPARADELVLPDAALRPLLADDAPLAVLGPEWEQRASREVCLTAYLPLRRSGVSLSQQTISSMSCPTCVGLSGRTNMSPRLMSISSSSVSVTDIGANASGRGPLNVSMLLTRVEKPDGSTVTSSPGRKTPPAIRPA